jgi:hypothetical protein
LSLPNRLAENHEIHRVVTIEGRVPLPMVDHNEATVYGIFAHVGDGSATGGSNIRVRRNRNIEARMIPLDAFVESLC